MRLRGSLAALGLTLLAIPLSAQQQQQQPPHGIDLVDPAPNGGAIAPPLPEKQRRQLKKLDIPELAGARQALGSQLIAGRSTRLRIVPPPPLTSTTTRPPSKNRSG